MDGKSTLLVRLSTLKERLQHERLQVAVLGQFKRGKSTFINALLGVPLLPTGVIPLTAIATFISWSPHPAVLVTFKGATPATEHAIRDVEDIRDVLFRFVAEEANPENRLGVERVDLLYPADILADGVVIIDTPGIGSTLRHNTETALQILPECDAAFFVVSADPPITEAELEYLNRLKSKLRRVFFVLNKADYLRGEERDSVVTFLRKVLADKLLWAPDGRVFTISARDALEAKLSGDAGKLQRSGFAALEDHLGRTLADGKARWLNDAIRGQVADILARASDELHLRKQALTMPIEELEAKSDAFRVALRSVEDQRRVTRDLLAGDHRRLRSALDARIGDLRRNIMEKLAALVDVNLSLKDREGTAAAALAQTVQHEFEAAHGSFASAFATDTGAALTGCEDRINGLAAEVRQIAAKIFDLELGADAEHEPFELGEDPYWVTETVNSTLIPDPRPWLDRLLPAALRRRRRRIRMIEKAGKLVIRNAENLRWAIVRGLDETFRKAAARFEERLDRTIAATRDVIRDALLRRQDRSFAVQPELDRLGAATKSLASLRDELEGATPHIGESDNT